MSPQTSKQIAQLIQMACTLEACAPKPGNVNRDHDFADTALEDFLLSALLIGKAFENAATAGVGQVIFDAVSDTRQWISSNTNLGMILLFAPLAKACQGICDINEIRPNLKKILDALTVEDARLAYAAIRLAQPGGLGKAGQGDVTEDPPITLLQAMTLAQDRDSIAREYATGYAISFELGLPAMIKAWGSEGAPAGAIVQTFLKILSEVPDTLIARKEGMETASRISKRANAVLEMGGVTTPEGRRALTEMDQLLRDPAHRLNPGTTADLTAVALFLALLARKLEKRS